MCLVNCEALSFLQHIEIITFAPVHEAPATSKGEAPATSKGEHPVK